MRRFSLPGVLQRCPRDDGPRDDEVEPIHERDQRHDERDDEREDELAPAALSPRVMTVGRASTTVRRWVLWTGLGVVLVLLVFLALRGPGEASSSSSVPVTSWPDDEAKSFAASFVREFLAYAPARVDEQQEILGRMLASGVSVADVVSVESRGGAQRVVDVSVVRSKDVGGGHGRVTVAATVVADGVKRRVGWAIPVARDAWGVV